METTVTKLNVGTYSIITDAPNPIGEMSQAVSAVLRRNRGCASGLSIRRTILASILRLEEAVRIGCVFRELIEGGAQVSPERAAGRDAIGVAFRIYEGTIKCKHSLGGDHQQGNASKEKNWRHILHDYGPEAQKWSETKGVRDRKSVV